MADGSKVTMSSWLTIRSIWLRLWVGWNDDMFGVDTNTCSIDWDPIVFSKILPRLSSKTESKVVAGRRATGLTSDGETILEDGGTACCS